MDIWSKKKRSAVMAKIRSKDTKPEWIVRRYLFSRGYRYLKNVKGLPGTPDIVLRKYGIVIFIHGCFWHGHKVDGHIPHSNSDYWRNKIKRNQQRDEKHKEVLKKMGWKVMTIWECQLKPAVREQTLHEMEYWINHSFLEHYRQKLPKTYEITENSPCIAADNITEYEKKRNKNAVFTGVSVTSHLNKHPIIMSSKSNDQGRAYEFVCLLTLEEKIKKLRPVNIIKNSSYSAAERAWCTLSNEMQETYKASSYVAVDKIFELEPRIVENNNDILELLIQTDAKGKKGDVRDILIIRHNIQWEIGLSLKHNHFAVKHSRLSRRLDFGKEWYGIPCSQDYWNGVKPIFDYLIAEKNKHTKFNELTYKENDVYIPLLTAFINEINRQYQVHKDIPGKLVEYLLGKHDFYKIISIDKEQTTRIQSYNLHGTLNQNSESEQASIQIPVACLPTRIVSLGFVPEKTNTVELYMDGGWQFSFRIHNAETYVVPTLKFDIQIVGMPTAIITINCLWK